MADKISVSEFQYNIDLKYVYKEEEIDIDRASIKNIVIDYEYDKRNMPIIILSVKLGAKTYSKISKYVGKAKMVLSIYKIENKKVKSLYIKDEFEYFLPKDTKYETDKAGESQGKTDKDKSGDGLTTEYNEVYIGLLKLSLMDECRRIFNNIFSNANMASVIHSFTSHLKMVFEPLDYNNRFDNLVVPPISSISKVLKYLNSVSSFYKTDYRFFMDFKYTYLISCKGNAINLKDNTYPIMKLNVVKVDEKADNDDIAVAGMVLDKTNKIYIVTLPHNNVSIDVNKVSDKMYNNIVGVSSSGNVKKATVNGGSTTTKQKVIFQRVKAENLTTVDNLKNTVDNTTVMLNIVKSEIDSSLFTLTREYRVSNIAEYKKYDGKYILSYKKEVFTLSGDYFTGIMSVGLRKVN